MTKKSKSNITMSVPEGTKFNTEYTFDQSYYETDRNGPLTSSFDLKLDLELKTIGELLKKKNKAYGNTALNPTNVFSKLNASEAICARLDDKLARVILVRISMSSILHYFYLEHYPLQKMHL